MICILLFESHLWTVFVVWATSLQIGAARQLQWVSRRRFLLLHKIVISWSVLCRLLAINLQFFYWPISSMYSVKFHLNYGPSLTVTAPHRLMHFDLDQSSLCVFLFVLMRFFIIDSLILSGMSWFQQKRKISNVLPNHPRSRLKRRGLTTWLPKLSVRCFLLVIVYWLAAPSDCPFSQFLL